MRSSSEAQSKAWLPDQDFPPPLRYGGSAFGGEPGQTPLRPATAGLRYELLIQRRVVAALE